MALVTTKEMFEKAYNGGYAVGAFNVWRVDRYQEEIFHFQRNDTAFVVVLVNAKAVCNL